MSWLAETSSADQAKAFLTDLPREPAFLEKERLRDDLLLRGSPSFRWSKSDDSPRSDQFAFAAETERRRAGFGPGEES